MAPPLPPHAAGSSSSPNRGNAASAVATVSSSRTRTRRGDGFRVYLSRCVRANHDVDWTPHTVDYVLFKARLKFFAHRRAQLRYLLRESPDQQLAKTVFDAIVEPQTKRIVFHDKTTTDETTIGVTTDDIGNGSSVVSTSMEPLTELLDGDISQHKLAPTMTEFKPMESIFFPLQCSGSFTEAEEEETATNKLTSAFPFMRPRRVSKRTIWRRVSNAERQEIVQLLTWELEKSALFYLGQWHKLTQQVIDPSTSSYVIPGDEVDSYGDEILELIAFCVINVVTVRQILIRFDAFSRTFGGTPLMNFYMKHALKHPTSLRKLLYHEELSALADVYEASLMDSSSTQGMQSLLSPLESPRNASYDTLPTTNFGVQRHHFRAILASSESAASIASTGHDSLSDTFIHTVRNWYLLGAFGDRLGFEPSYLTMRGKSLKKEITQLAEWRQYRERVSKPDVDKPVQKLSGMQVYHLTLNLISGFLYCMNYYIVEPSSTLYVNRLGAFDAMSGTLIGMMPLAAFFSSIPYSYWTNHSFRHPFIMSCILLIVGNITYSLADRFSHMWMALLGRFICGLGAPKCIIRRYMADTTPISLRTSVNAGFGMVVAAGSAMGPAMAVLLNNVDYTWHAPYFGFLFFNGLTLPGWFMAYLWTTFFIIVLATFEEPDRFGLQEQMELENAANAPVVESPIHIEDTQTMLSFGGDQDELRTIFSGEEPYDCSDASQPNIVNQWSAVTRNARYYLDMITFPVRVCLLLLFSKVFTIEALVSSTSALSKNRYKWGVKKVGTLGFTNGLLVIPFSILVGRLSMSYQDHALMRGLVVTGSLGLFLLIDISDLLLGRKNHRNYNADHRFAVGPKRYILGYFLSYLSIQAFEGVIGSTLSKVIPTALASGTLNSGLLATLVDTFGRACGDMFISAMGYINLRQLMNLLFIPTFTIMILCLCLIERYRDLLSV